VATLGYASGDTEFTDRTSAGSAPQPARTRRLRRPTWRDPRVLIGIALILTSVVGVVLLVNSQNRTAPVYAADRELSTGTRLSADDLQVVHVQLDAAAGHYLSAEAEPPPDVELTRPLSEGELLPAAALGAVDSQLRQAVTVEVQHDLARSVQPGRRVDVWSASGYSTVDDTGEVTRLAAAAEVTDIRESSSAFGTSAAVTVELLVDPDEVTGLLAAFGAGDALTVLPAGARED
jgi:Flp pilus assembly protein CpaB